MSDDLKALLDAFAAARDSGRLGAMRTRVTTTWPLDAACPACGAGLARSSRIGPWCQNRGCAYSWEPGGGEENHP